MSWLSSLRPRRSLTLPLLVVAVPALYFVYRDAAIGCPPTHACLEAAHGVSMVARLVGSYLVVCAAFAVVDESALADRNSYARLAFRPADRTLAVLGVFVAAFGAHLTATLVGVSPWLDAVLTPLGLALAFPFTLGSALLIALADAVFTEPPLGTRTVTIAVSLALTAVWMFALATGTAGLLGSRLPARVGSG